MVSINPNFRNGGAAGIQGSPKFGGLHSKSDDIIGKTTVEPTRHVYLTTDESTGKTVTLEEVINDGCNDIVIHTADGKTYTIDGSAPNT